MFFLKLPFLFDNHVVNKLLQYDALGMKMPAFLSLNHKKNFSSTFMSEYHRARLISLHYS